ncbi:hypothetical protein PIB30_026298 [Stylosanthes scabra]|uniref:DUF4283 domain-containing protein n=1 Tax=Stylosanthes scabra TaxID=79078 RepID=A0ABU6V9B6_9FABA|nr:hypothetical protein [Stylosanthes scabra]
MALPVDSSLQPPSRSDVEEEPVITLDATDIKHGIDRCSKSLVGRVLSDRSFSHLIKIERGSPWLFKNFILNLKRWKEDLAITDAEFIDVPIWIQFWNLPKHYKSKEIGWKLGSSFGDVIEAYLFQVRGLESSIVKAKV